jgi:hypothetical protein
MGKWTSEILMPGDAPGKEGHIPEEQMAALAEGKLDAETRRPLVAHLNRCRECYTVFEAILTDVERDMGEGITTPGRRGIGGKTYAVAASVVIFIMAGVLYHSFQQGMTSHVLEANLIVDNPLRGILMEDSAVRWESSDRVDRLAGLLRARGVDVGKLNIVVLAKPYYPAKSILPPKETLNIRIEEGVAYLMVVEGTIE